jgi:hypothetical protein
MKKIITFMLLIAFSGAVMSQDNFSSVEERMTGREFKDSGLDKLSDAELEALNKWLRDHSVATLENVTAGRGTAVAPGGSVGVNADGRGFELRQSDTTTIVSRLVGEFTGWDGETIFTLENGMVWKQGETDRFFTKTLANPMVTIKAGMWGAWRLSVEGYNKSVKVKRIQ